MSMKKKYSLLEVEILATVSGAISLKDIHLIEDANNIWLKYAEPKTDNPKIKHKRRKKKQYYKKRRRERYLRDESAYTKGQEEEFPKFLEYLEPAVNYVLDKYLPTGSSFEYYTKLHDNLICLCLKKNYGKSLRRSMGFIRYVVSREFPDVKIPCFKGLDNYQNNPVVSFYADKILEVTSQSLSAIETDFTTDGTGEATVSYSTWYSIKVGKECRKRDHKMAQVTSTIKLNAAVVVDVLEHEDKNLMQNHIEITSQSFNIKNWSADNLYLTRNNCTSIRDKGGKAHIRIREENITDAKGSPEWKRTVTLQKQKDEQELNDLNMRQNAESTNSAKKRKFGSCTLCVNDWSQVNDIKISWCCYNFSVLSRAYYEQDIVPMFLTHKFSRSFFRLGVYT
jgi:hypothetical protein